MSPTESDKKIEKIRDNLITKWPEIIEFISNSQVESFLETKPYPKESIKLLRDIGKKPGVIKKASLCRTLSILQDKDPQVFDWLLPAVKKCYPNLEREGSQNSWNTTYQTYLKEYINQQLQEVVELFDDLLYGLKGIIEQ
ncbi:hypothetical protein [Nostoc sp. 'Lobaria pulmonaria (5183) cyanobiont']|uniref:hypothetical protein n=1 Tax=Nostoc sp. 'Lobaria pulmonaria (5183) cyanobiont' TaxID=1618022 RepID=UPI000CF331B7|nr:hypothetical protein [Nostoc sp. 'Lobaria pulmonaria (5183) cyanobiont']AVH73299.1 hypothetical protein NLP_4935 [Nostoc sp. 'Lobaria pulmonaria (5183) cyanobiont']